MDPTLEIIEDSESESPNILSRDQLIDLMIRQLQYYELLDVADFLAEKVQLPITFAPSQRLAELSFMGLNADASDDSEDEVEDEVERSNNERVSEDVMDISTGDGLGSEIDVTGEPKPSPAYNTVYITTHKFGCTTAAFSTDGRFVATGSADTSLKVLDVSRLSRKPDSTEEKPVIKTLYDHTLPVNDLAFHPNGQVLASCSDDMSIKLFDLHKHKVKRSFRYLQDSAIIHSISFHPSGDFIASGTDHNMLKIYDIKTFQCYTPEASSELHKGAILQVRYSHNGRQIVTASRDGSIKIWDGVSGKCVKTIENAHGCKEVSSVAFSKGGNYILSGGRDSVSKLWDISSGRVIIKYEGATQFNTNLQTTFNWNEDYVLSSDESSNTIVCWDSRTGKFLKRMGGHLNTVRWVATSPCTSAFISCSDDHRARFWDVEDM